MFNSMIQVKKMPPYTLFTQIKPDWKREKVVYLANNSRKELTVIKEETAVKTWTLTSNYLANYCQQFIVRIDNGKVLMKTFKMSYQLKHLENQ